MTPVSRRLAWPLGVSLAAHALLGAWCWLRPAKPAAQWPVTATLSLRLMAAPAAATPATIVAAATPRPITPPRKPGPKPVPKPAPKAPKPPSHAEPVESDEPVVAAATGTSAPTPTSAPAPVAGVAFAPPRLGPPFGAAARSTWTPRPAAAVAMPPTVAGPTAQASLSLLRQQGLDGLAHQVAEWTAPDHLDSARCRVSADADADSECDPAALADVLAQRLQSLREAWAAYRRLAPEAPAGLVIAYADGHFSLSTPAR